MLYKKQNDHFLRQVLKNKKSTVWSGRSDPYHLWISAERLMKRVKQVFPHFLSVLRSKIPNVFCNVRFPWHDNQKLRIPSPGTEAKEELN